MSAKQRRKCEQELRSANPKGEIRFTTDKQQQENLFDLCVGIAMVVIVILTFAFNTWQQTRSPAQKPANYEVQSPSNS